jgi:hypothetical protein
MALLSRDYPMKGSTGVMRKMPAGEIISYFEDGIHWRKERILIEGVEFFRFTANPGFQDEVGTFWSRDAAKLKKLITKRVRR